MLKDGGLMKIEIKALGEKLIRDLDLIDDYDVLTKWMLNYIAEQMHKYETARTEEEKQIAGRQCSDTIMMFWKNRSHYATWYPFSNYKELYDGLNELFNDNASLAFLDDLISRTNDTELMAKIKNIKKVTRWLLEQMIEDCFSSKYEDGDEEWINLLSKSEDGDDARVLKAIEEAMEQIDIVEDVVGEQIHCIEDVISMYKNLAEHKKQLILDIKESGNTVSRQG